MTCMEDTPGTQDLRRVAARGARGVRRGADVNDGRADGAVLDRTDLRLLAELVENGRLTNAALAARVGIAESTCSQRVRALRESGVVRRFTADVDPAALGLGIQAVVKVRLATHGRDHVLAFQSHVQQIPGVLTIFHVAGEDDYLLHVAVESAAGLRDLVLEHLNVHPIVRHTETQLVFEVLRGSGILPSA